ncbi:MAG TPA: hypothetical protein VEC97_05205 [Candidatus Acidoferrales bacterium]|nr:hypothetical protein [Candidatus Acidoferrales bacterium]
MNAFLYALTLLSALIGTVRAADESFTSQFLDSPLLALAALVVIDVIAFIYHKMRK